MGESGEAGGQTQNKSCHYSATGFEFGGGEKGPCPASPQEKHLIGTAARLIVDYAGACTMLD